MSHETRPAASLDGPRDALAAEVRRVADRFRSLSQARLDAAAPPYPSRAAAGRRAAQMLAETAQGIEERDAAGEPVWREVPTLSAFAVGDQVAVTGHDLVAALSSVESDGPVWSRGCRRTAGEALAGAAQVLAEVRRLL